MTSELQQKRKAPIIPKQKEILVDFMQMHEELFSGKFTASFSKQSAAKLWVEVSVLLNAVPGGSKKNWTQWRKTWQDLKKNVKSRAVVERTYARGTGGGPSHRTDFDQTETKVLNLLSPKSKFGDETVPVPEVTFALKDVEQQSIGPAEVLPGSYHIVDTEIVMDESFVNESDASHLVQPKTQATTPHTSQNVTGSRETTKRKTLMKTKRLESSIGVANNLVKVEQEKKESAEKYFAAKIKYLEWRKEYEEKKLETLTQTKEIFANIFTELKDIKKTILEK